MVGAPVSDDPRRDRLIVTGLLLVTLLLRVASFWAAQSGPYSYDLISHLQYMKWFETHDTLPSCQISRVATHPPLFHYLSGRLLRTGAALLDVRWISLVAALLRASLVFVALHRLIASRPARWFALALLAVLPVSVHVDGMVSNESLSCLFCAATIWIVVEALRAPRPWLWLLAGVTMGLAWLSKASVLTIALALGAALVAARERRAFRAAPLLLVGFAVVAGWHVAHNLQAFGKLVPLTFDCRELGDAAPYLQTPYWQRRSLGFFLGFEPQIFATPYLPTGLEPPRFWSVLLASTFADYYNYGFGHRNTVEEIGFLANDVAIDLPSLWLSRLSVAGGALLATGVIAGWGALLQRELRTRRAEALFVLAVPALAVLGLLHFATRYPIDYLGMIKGAYLLYSAPAFAAIAGYAFAWSWARARWLGAVWIIALLAVAAYSIACRIPFYAYPE